MSATINRATIEIDEILPMLNNAYWEASNQHHKDMIHNITWLLTMEVIELHKVSVQDGHYKYDPVNDYVRHIMPELRWFSENMSKVICRTESRLALGHQLQKVIELFN